LIIVDFNFDGKDDIAIINDSGGNGGPLYNFYIQNQKGLFSLNKFLTEQMSFFPAYINKKEKTLTTFVHAGVNRIAKTIYKFNVADQTWKQIKLIYLRPK